MCRWWNAGTSSSTASATTSATAAHREASTARSSSSTRTWPLSPRRRGERSSAVRATTQPRPPAVSHERRPLIGLATHELPPAEHNRMAQPQHRDRHALDARAVPLIGSSPSNQKRQKGSGVAPLIRARQAVVGIFQPTGPGPGTANSTPQDVPAGLDRIHGDRAARSLVDLASRP